MKKSKSNANENVKNLNDCIKTDSNRISQEEQIKVFAEIIVELLIKDLNEKDNRK